MDREMADDGIFYYYAEPARRITGSDSSYLSLEHPPDEQQGPDDPMVTTTAKPTPDQANNWPDGPEFLHGSRVVVALTALLDLLLIMFAVAFLALAIIAASIDNSPTGSSFGKSFEEAIKLGPTIYPILFAAIIGRALKNIGRYQAERGARVSTLWPLFNNKTMFDAVISQWQLAQFSIVGTTLVFLWALSPLGGQATLRLVYRTNLTSTATMDLRYLDTGPLGDMWAYRSVIEENDVEANSSGLPLTMPTLYNAALMQDAATKRGPRDNWGNIKIPRVDNLDRSQADADGWIDVSNTTSVTSYYSLLGLPVVNLPNSSLSQFNVEAVYVALEAASRRFYTPTQSSPSPFLEITCPDCKENDRRLVLWGPPFPQPDKAELLNATFSQPRYIKFDAAGYTSGTDTIFCAVTQHFVEADIRCQFGSCRAARVRTSRTDKRSPNITSFDWWGSFALDMISVESRARSSTVVSASTLFINDSDSSPTKPSFQDGSLSYINFTQADPQRFADHATILLNTALNIFMAPSGFTGALRSDNMTIYGVPHIPADGPMRSYQTIGKQSKELPPTDLDLLVESSRAALAPFVAANTTARATTLREVYKPDGAWVVVLAASSAVLIAVGIAGMWLGQLSRAPDAFDPLMGLTYNNPHLGIPPGSGSALGASERARLLSRATIRLGDVRPDSEIGRISLGQAALVRRLRKKRMYE